MFIKRVEYKGMTISAGACEVLELNHFISTLCITKKRGTKRADVAKLYNPPWPADLFDDAEVALDTAIAFGRSVIDREFSDLTADDPKAERGC